MAPRYKLTYFDLRGRAEPTRIALAYAGVDYDDVRVSFENRFEGEWSEIKNSKWKSDLLYPRKQSNNRELENVVWNIIGWNINPWFSVNVHDALLPFWRVSKA